jgi:hypothetical protein
LIATGRAASPSEIGAIIARIASASFFTGESHHAKRVREEQWPSWSTAAEYVADLQRAARDPEANLILYERRGGNLAAILARSGRSLPSEWPGVARFPFLVVVYSADRGTIVSGYLASGMETISLPEGARWLR